MKIEVYFSHSFVSTDSEMYKVKDGYKPTIDRSTSIKVKDFISKGWRLSHAIKTSQSAQLESFNFLLIFEK